MEKWKDIAGWEGLYQVSDRGRVKALPRSFVTKNRWGAMIKHLPERFSKLKLAKGDCYLAVTLTHKGRIERRLVHRLVCEAFHGPCPSQQHHCAHGDGNPTNNRAENLRWATVSENSKDTRKHGNMRLGEKCNWAKLTAGQVLEIRLRASNGESFASLGREFGVTGEGVSKIARRENWRHI